MIMNGEQLMPNEQNIPSQTPGGHAESETAVALAGPPQAVDTHQVDLSPGRIDYDPPLLTCLAVLMRLAGKPISIQAIKSGLPLGSAPPNAATCVRAAERVGMQAKIVYRDQLAKISPLTLPCILLLENNNA